MCADVRLQGVQLLMHICIHIHAPYVMYIYMYNLHQCLLNEIKLFFSFLSEKKKNI